MRYSNKYEVIKYYILKTLSYRLDYPLVKPERVNIATTFACPLECEMCGLPTSDVSDKEEIEYEEWCDIIDQLMDWGVKHISFSGGETLVKPDKTINLINYAKEKGHEIDLITNGYNINQDLAERIMSTGVDRITISIDGSKKEIHDSIRGEGSFDKAIESCKNLENSRYLNPDVELEFSTVVMKKNYDDLLNIYELLNELDFDFISYQALVPDNSFEDQSYNDDLWLSEKESTELKKICQGLIEIKEETGEIRNTKKYLRKMPEYFLNKEKFGYGKCMAGYEVIHIDPYGDIDICGFGSSLNVRNKNLKNVWWSERYKSIRKNIKNCNRPCLLLCYRKLDLEDMLRTHFEASIANE